jgi:phage tail-like protein
MATQRERPYSTINFLVDLGTGNTDGPAAGMVEVILPEARLQISEYRSGNEKENNSRKLQTLAHYENLILKRAVTGSLDWYQWWDEVRNGSQVASRNIFIQLVNEDHSVNVLTWKFLRARPVSHQFGPLNAMSTEPLIETLELAFERLEME